MYGRKKRMYRPKKSRRRGGSSWRKYGAAAGSLAYKAYKGVKYIKSLINVEKKFHDVSDATTYGTTPAVISLTNIAQGNDFNNRDGNSILLQSLQLKADIKHDMNKQGCDNIRVILFQDNDQRGTDPAAGDLLETGSGFSWLNAFVSHNAGSRFNILYDRKIKVSDQDQTKSIKLIRKFYSNHVKYTGTTAADSSTYKGALFMLVVSDENTTPPAMSWGVRVRFTDN
jgi:hypothetical protein